MSVHDFLKAAYLKLGRTLSNNRFLDYKWFLEQEVNTWKRWHSLPLRRRIWLWRRGFTSPQWKLYDFETYDPELFLSELQRYRLYKRLNGRHRYLLDDKLSQHWMLADYPKNRPASYGFVDGGRVHGLAGTRFEGEPTPVSEWLPPKVREHSKLVLKQLRGKGGSEVLVCEYDDGYRLDGEAMTEEHLCERVARLSGYLVTEYVNQHRYADDLFPRATNTIRILTLWDERAGEVLAPVAVQRIGTARSSPIDNFSAGGIAARIDLETGTLSSAARKPQFTESGDVQWYSVHPDTGVRIEGASIPNWTEILSTVERFATANTNIPAIGWDVLLDESGDPVVIEANTGTGFELLQVHGPLLTDPRVARLVSRHLPSVEEQSSHGRRDDGQGPDSARPDAPTVERPSE